MPDFRRVGGRIKYSPGTISIEFYLWNDKTLTGLLIVVTIHGEASFTVFQVQNDQLFHSHSIEGDEVKTRVSVDSFAEKNYFACTITVTNDATARLSLGFKIETLMDDNSEMVLTVNGVEYELVLCANGVAYNLVQRTAVLILDTDDDESDRDADNLVQRVAVLVLDTDDDESDRDTDNDSRVSDSDDEVMNLN